jgi:hypothetical protein
MTTALRSPATFALRRRLRIRVNQAHGWLLARRAGRRLPIVRLEPIAGTA